MGTTQKNNAKVYKHDGLTALVTTLNYIRFLGQNSEHLNGSVQ